MQQVAHYRGILGERSELQRIQTELQTTKDSAEARRQYHLTAVNHLEGKIQVMMCVVLHIGRTCGDSTVRNI